MKLKHLFTINLFMAIFFGLSCSVFAIWMIRLYGLDPTPANVWPTRLVGGSILGYASLMWFGIKAASRESRQAIAMALLIQDSIGLIASLEIQLGGNINTFGWSNPILYGLLALGYTYFLFISPEKN